MPTQLEAKSFFRKILGLMVANIAWPLVAGTLVLSLTLLGFESIGWISFLLTIVMLALFVWLVVEIWKAAPHADTTPWVWLWLFLPIYGMFIIGMMILEPLKYMADGLPESQRLPLSWPLIKKTLAAYYESLHITIKTSAWFLYLSLGFGIILAIVVSWESLGLLIFPAGIVFAVLAIWVTIKLILEIASLDEGKNVSGTEGKLAQQNFLSYAWVAILGILIIIAVPVLLIALFILMLTVLGMGTLKFVSNITQGDMSAITAASILQVLVLLGILLLCLVGGSIWTLYKSNQLTFSVMTLLLGGKKGYEALKESMRIVKRRWWGLFWKMQLWGMCFGIISLILALVMMVIAFIITFITKSLPFALQINQIVSLAYQGLIQMLVAPLGIIFLVKLYRAFLRSAKK